MVGENGLRGARALCLGLALALLGACASTPAPVDHTGLRGRVTQTLPPPLFDPSEPPRVTDYRARLQCVPYARDASGIEIYGNANTWWVQAEGRYPRSSIPAAGSVLVMRGYRTSARGHVAYVTHVESSRLIRVDHANWLNGGEITRDVPIMDVSEAGDWSEVKVWHVPGRHWGGRTYQVQGFILNILTEAAQQQAALQAANDESAAANADVPIG